MGGSKPKVRVTRVVDPLGGSPFVEELTDRLEEKAAAYIAEPYEDIYINVLKLLAQAGLVESFRGAAGGYRLTKAPAQIPLIAIVEALEGPLGMTACSVHDGECGIASHCGIRAGWQRINDVLVDALQRTTLADMLAPVPTKPENPKAIPAALVRST